MTNRDASRRPFHTDNQPIEHAAPTPPAPADTFAVWDREFRANGSRVSFGLYEKALDFYDQYVMCGRPGEGRIFMRLVQGASDRGHEMRHEVAKEAAEALLRCYR